MCSPPSPAPTPQFLIRDHSVSVDPVNWEGWTPLLCAVSRSHIEVADFLLRNGANLHHTAQPSGGWGEAGGEGTGFGVRGTRCVAGAAGANLHRVAQPSGGRAGWACRVSSRGQPEPCGAAVPWVLGAGEGAGVGAGKGQGEGHAAHGMHRRAPTSRSRCAGCCGAAVGAWHAWVEGRVTLGAR